MENFGLPSLGGVPVVGATSQPLQVVTPNVGVTVKEEPMTAVTPAAKYFAEPETTIAKEENKAIAKAVIEDILKADVPVEEKKAPVKKAPAKKAAAKAKPKAKPSKKPAAKAKAKAKPKKK